LSVSKLTALGILKNTIDSILACEQLILLDGSDRDDLD